MMKTIFPILLLALSTFNAGAAPFMVTNTGDSGAGSLRQAILDSNTAAGSDTITFDPIVFSTPQTIVLAGTVLTINPATGDTLTITGPGASLLTVSGNNAVRVFAISPGDTVSISNMTVTQGNGTTGASPGFGGGIYNQGILTLTNVVVTGNTATIDGGGVYNSTSDTLNVINCTISNNIGDSDNSGSGTGGGGLYSTTGGIMTVTNSTITGNSVGSNASGGGGIASFGPATITNCTISGNSSGVDGGGIYKGNSGVTLTLTNSTVVGNTAARDGGGVDRDSSGTFSVRNTIIANNTDDGTAPDFNGTVNSQGYNLIENITGATITGITTGNITGVDPNLGPLQDNGGDTFTHALLAGTPALDQGESSGTTTDQSGAPRPIDNPSVANATGGDGADIGAFEVQPPESVGIVSRKAHGGAGMFDINLPLAGQPGLECRSSGGNHTLVFFATNNLAGGTPSVTSGIGAVQGTPTFAVNSMTVELTGVADVQQITVTFSSVTDDFGQILPDTAVSMNLLIGDTSGNKTVNGTDVSQTKLQSGSAVGAANFRTDVNASGGISGTDVSIVKSRSGSGLP